MKMTSWRRKTLLKNESWLLRQIRQVSNLPSGDLRKGLKKIYSKWQVRHVRPHRIIEIGQVRQVIQVSNLLAWDFRKGLKIFF